MHRRAITLALCLAAAFTTLLDQSSLNTAVPALRASLGAGESEVQWIIAGYSLTFGLALVPSGRLGDAYGRKWLFVLGIALFSTAAIVAGTAQEAWVVAVARLVQGVGAGTVNPQVLGIIQELFDGPGRTKALGAYAIVGGVAGVIGPLVGGLLIDTYGWRSVLLLNVPFGLVTVPLAIKWFPRRKPREHRHASLDLPGLALLGGATLCLLLPFTGADQRAWIAGVPLLVAALIAWERRYARRGGTPILLPALLRERGYRTGTLIATFQFGASLSVSLAITLYLQEKLGWPALHAGLTVLPGALGFALLSAIGWRVVGRHGRRGILWALVGSLGAVTSTIGVLHWVPGRWLGLGLGLTQLASGAASGLIISPNQALTLLHAPPGAAGLAAAFLQLAQRISATVGTAAVAGVVLGGSGPGPITGGLAICAGMLAAAVAVAWRDLARESLTGSLNIYTR
ncbi:MFS transporter [Paractinoplanes lichenicola]|uniref:MFS transporter n=1 Tax=Paractinoplanes lichenicola TaxID=2802976 RepID=A0ABS1VZR2_9ACTN|nr:MFS transporter [Actinoplanes lichenicola]MBL7259979.1 MFS transporter [Actinoplanes lichenicola]